MERQVKGLEQQKRKVNLSIQKKEGRKGKETDKEKTEDFLPKTVQLLKFSLRSLRESL